MENGVITNNAPSLRTSKPLTWWGVVGAVVVADILIGLAAITFFGSLLS